MKTAAGLLKTVAKATVPAPARRWAKRHGDSATAALQRILVPKMDFQNRERYANFNFSLLSKHTKKGTTALMRVKNEASKIYFSLTSILDVFDEVVLVDNGSTDSTLEIVRRVKEQRDKTNKIKIFSYPFTISRCGQEHWKTADDSIHSIVYYYNWALSRCSLQHVCKWDGDMVLQKASRARFGQFLKQHLGQSRALWMIEGQTVYRDTEGNFWLAKGELIPEPRLFPYGYNPRFFKGEVYEVLSAEPRSETRMMDGVSFFELKFADEDEFSHWTSSEIPTVRKRRELESFRLVRQGRIDVARFDRLPTDFLEQQLS